jgi:uncharacterized membrane protein YoaK (UPF0700 family)
LSTFLEEVRETLYPSYASKDGPLPPMLVTLTVVTGLVDSFSYLVLGHVFVANMTGNVVFLAFALAGSQGFSIVSSLIAIGSFVLGAISAGRIGAREGFQRGQMLAKVAAVQALLLAVSLITSILSGKPIPVNLGYIVIILIAFSMGMQNSAVRKLAVPDLTTTVLTLTMVGIGADSKIAGGSGSKAGRRLISVFAMFFGALIGALTILYSSIVYPLVIATILVAVVAALTWVFSRRDSPWAQSRWQAPPGK